MSGDRPVESLRFRHAFRQVPGPVAIVLVQGEHGVVGITCTSATSLSGEPPMVLACVDDKTGMERSVRAAGRFSVNYLAADRAAWARAFSSRGRDLDALSAVIGTGRTLVPTLLTGTTAVLECRVETIHRGGDHWILCGLVSHARHQSDADPLMYLDGSYGSFTAGGTGTARL